MKFVRSLWRVFWLVIYYGFARYLPTSYQPIGSVFMRIRELACRNIFESMGQNVNIERGVYFASGSGVEIGDFSGMGENCRVPVNIKIGCDVMIGPDVLIIGQNHNHKNLEIPMRLQGSINAPPVVIGDDVWIGARVIILPGLVIGKGSIIAAGAVVTKDMPPFAICAGNPAGVIKLRTDKEMNI